MHYWNDGGWGIFWMILWMILLIGALTAVVVFLVRGVSPGSAGRSERPRDAREILDERFARGEISEEEYRTRRRVLDESRG
jgi:putative membrane protein